MFGSGPGSETQLLLQLPYHCWRFMRNLAIACETEVNGFGYIKLFPGGIFRVQKVFILDQVATTWSVDTVDSALHAHLAEMHQQGISPELLRFQWHSHCDAPAYFSETDEANIERWPGDWLVSLVLNRRGETLCRFDQFGKTRLKVGMVADITFPGPTARELQLARGLLDAHVRTQSHPTGILSQSDKHPREEHDQTQLHAPDRVL